MGTLWSVLYFYCNWQIPAPKKIKTQHGSGREWESFFRDWNGTGFSPSFFVGLGWDFFFVGVGRERFENPLPCHPLLDTHDPDAGLSLLASFSVSTNHFILGKPHKRLAILEMLWPSLAITMWPLSKSLRSFRLAIFSASNTWNSRANWSLPA